MTQAVFASTDDIRSLFSHAMSQMYRAEVPLYGDLIEIVEAVNGQVLASRPALAADLAQAGDLDRLSGERHGAIRVGTAGELRLMARAFAVMGMHPVGYYDLTVAGVPVHSTAFRPIDNAALQRNPFRVFTSLLRLELIEDVALRAAAADILADREICTPGAIALIGQAEDQGGLSRLDAERFVAELLETFRWHSQARVDAETYLGLNAAHRLIADVVSFRGPHINHLTPRTLDIDAAQAEMVRRGMGAKPVIEGPPTRATPILLRQTSFKAIEEEVCFLNAAQGQKGMHTARFGEIEQRGVALTPKGRALYDALLAQARGADGAQGPDYEQRLRAAFTRFPDTLDELRQEKLAYFRYEITPSGQGQIFTGDLDDGVAAGHVAALPITYEDFLPVSAAGIFQSNLGGAAQHSYTGAAQRDSFEQALGAPVLDECALYEAMMQASIDELRLGR